MASSFFKILLDPSACNLSLPADLKTQISNAVIITSANGGYSWKLKIKQISDGYCFSDGWSDVVKDSQLGFGDFLLFQPLDQSTFKLSIYSPNGCEKILPPKTDGNGGGDDGVSEFENIVDREYNDDDNDNDDDPFFTAVMTTAHTKHLRLPGEFTKLSQIDEEGSMVVKTVDGKEWVTGLRLDKSYRITKRYLLCAGWSAFLRANDLSQGDECVFRFIRSERKLLLEKVTKNKRPVRQPQPLPEVLVRKKQYEMYF